MPLQDFRATLTVFRYFLLFFDIFKFMCRMSMSFYCKIVPSLVRLPDNQSVHLDVFRVVLKTLKQNEKNSLKSFEK